MNKSYKSINWKKKFIISIILLVCGIVMLTIFQNIFNIPDSSSIEFHNSNVIYIDTTDPGIQVSFGVEIFIIDMIIWIYIIIFFIRVLIGTIKYFFPYIINKQKEIISKIN